MNNKPQQVDQSLLRVAAQLARRSVATFGNAAERRAGSPAKPGTCDDRLPRRRRWPIVSVLAAAVWGFFPALLPAQDFGSSTTRPALQELNDETTSLYQQVEAGMVHVEIPQQLPANRILPPTPPPAVKPLAKPSTTQPAGAAEV
ncbi:MAG TPA: hypothetical protein VGD75_22200, partial [Bradyrhizobium sp.]